MTTKDKNADEPVLDRETQNRLDAAEAEAKRAEEAEKG